MGTAQTATYAFGDLTAGLYRIDFGNGQMSDVVALGAGQTLNNLAPRPAPAGSVVEGVVALDKNYDRAANDGAGAQGVIVSLVDASGAVVAETLTSSAGHYSFGNVASGDYTVRFEAVKKGVVLSGEFGSRGDSGVLESAVSVNGGSAASVNLIAADLTNMDAEFGAELIVNGDMENNPIGESAWTNTSATRVEGWSSSTGNIHIQESNYGSGNRAGRCADRAELYKPRNLPDRVCGRRWPVPAFAHAFHTYRQWRRSARAG